MVNTFLTDANFSVSASSLDSRRLGKQRVEGLQILRLIEHLTFCAKYFRDPIPPDHRQRREWIRSIVRKYQALPYRFIIRETSIRLFIQVDLNVFRQIPKKMHFKKPITIEGIEIHPSDIVMSFGFVYHPAVQMWLGHKDALCAYINAHIQEWIRRGNANTMKIYAIPEVYSRPEWTYDEKIHRIHRASLLKKEKERNESPWYIQQDTFINAGEFTDYEWPL